MPTRKRVLLVALLSSLFVGCTSFVNKATFHPSPGESYDLADFDTDIQRVTLKTADHVNISSYFLPNPKANKALLLFHGNAGNASDRLPEAEVFHSYGLNVLLMDYRGYGLSEGSPSEGGIYKDAAAGLAYLQAQGFRTEEIFLYGRSLGTTVAVELAQYHPYAGLILLSPLSSGKNVAKYRGISWLIPFQNPFNSLEKIPKNTAPLLLVHGEQDRVLPINMGQDLFAAAKEPKQFLAVKEGGHNDLLSRHATLVYNAIQQFIDPLN
ncbi:MAG: alpha/beta hydrolase [Methylococcales bacterium]|mgnify:FL=1|jgi:uncharacterized protein|nr:alpha/beta hydrolase [Methylococcales bacterium]MBT7444594.1 alpha/beta hydrolase [Methylococcales bacterium]